MLAREKKSLQKRDICFARACLSDTEQRLYWLETNMAPIRL